MIMDTPPIHTHMRVVVCVSPPFHTVSDTIIADLTRHADDCLIKNPFCIHRFELIVVAVVAVVVVVYRVSRLYTTIIFIYKKCLYLFSIKIIGAIIITIPSKLIKFIVCL